MSRTSEATKNCARCGTPFGCGATDTSKPCWCTELPILDPLPKDIKDCMCPNCLKLELAKHPTNIAKG